MSVGGLEMKCPKCEAYLYIDAWNGWVWSCFHCDYIGREATDEEIREYEIEL